MRWHDAFDRFAGLLLRRRGFFAVLTALGAFAALALASRTQADFTIGQLFASADPEIAVLERFRARFGADDDRVVLLVQADDVLAAPVLRWIRNASDRARQLEVVRRVDSLTTVTDLGSTADGSIDTRPLFGHEPASAEERARLRQRALTSPLFAGRLLARDSTLAVIALRLAKEIVSAKQMGRAVDAIRAFLDRVPPPAGVRLELVGVPVVRTHLVRMIRADQWRFIPLTGVITTLLLFLLYRSVQRVIIPSLAIALSVAATLGMMVALGIPMDVLSNVLPVLVIVYGVADAVHMLGRFDEAHATGESRAQAIRTMVRHLGLACLLTSFTTAVGFASLLTASLGILRRFGWLAAVGVMLAYVISMVVVPLGMSLSSRAPPSGPALVDALFERLLSPIATVVTRWPRTVVLLAVLLAGAMLAVGSRVVVNSALLSTLQPDHPTARATRLMGRKLQGVSNLDLVVEGGPGALKDPRVLAALQDLGRWLARDPAVTGVLSPADFVAEMHRAVVGPRQLPASRAAVAQLLLMAEGQTGLERLVDFTFSRGRLQARLRDIGARAHLELVERTRARLAPLAALGLRAHVTGTPLVAYRGVDRLVSNLLLSLSVALVVIALILAAAFRSLVVGLLSMVPNLIPLSVGIGFMVLAGFTLNPTTVMVFSIAFGIAVDDTIHFIARYREEAVAATDEPERSAAAAGAVRRALLTTGRAMVVTSTILIVGFAVTLVSNFPSTQRFGTIGSVILAAAIGTDLLVTPAVMMALKPWIRRR